MTEPVRRPSLCEAARRGAGANHQRASPATARGATSSGAVGLEQVSARCGHPVPMDLYPDGKDKFRASRRKHIADRDCPACRQRAHEERTKADMEAARERRASKKKQETEAKDRLPHGSRFDVAWDAEKGLWTGTLTLPAAAGGESAVFTASASGVFRLLRTLDGMYRETLPGAAAP